MGIETGAAVVVRRRLFLVEDQPVALCDGYYRAEMVERTVIGESRLIRDGALTVIEDPAGRIRRTVVRSVDEL